MRRIRQLGNQHRRWLHDQHPRRAHDQPRDDELRERRGRGLDDRGDDDADDACQQDFAAAVAVGEQADDGEDENGAEGLGGVDEAQEGAGGVVEVVAPLVG